MKGDICSVIGCDLPELNRANALCDKHYSRFKRFRRRGPRSIPADVRFIPLRGVIESRYLSNGDVARLCDLPIAAIAKVLSGRRDLTADELDRICHVLGVQPSDIGSEEDLQRVRTVNFAGRPNLSLEQRFWAKVEKVESGCWEWQGFRFVLGYGSFNGIGVSSQYAHRTAYELSVGPIPEGLVLDHLCRNPPCVNPAHLEPVTPRENSVRGVNLWAYAHREGKCKKRGHLLPPGVGKCAECERERQRLRGKKQAS